LTFFVSILFLINPGRGTTRKAIGGFPLSLSKFSNHMDILSLKDFNNAFKLERIDSLSDFNLTIGLNA